MEFLVNMSVVSVVINNLSMALMTRRAVALTAKRTLLQRWRRGYPPREWGGVVGPDDIPTQDDIDWKTWEWREADKFLGIPCSCGTAWPSHETWAAMELALPRFVLGLAIIGVAELANMRSVSACAKLVQPTPVLFFYSFLFSCKEAHTKMRP